MIIDANDNGILISTIDLITTTTLLLLLLATTTTTASTTTAATTTTAAIPLTIENHLISIYSV